MTVHVIWSGDRSHLQLETATLPSGSVNSAVITLLTSGCSADSPTLPSSSTSLTVTATFMSSKSPDVSVTRMVKS